MNVMDKALKIMVNVSKKDCPTFACYWPRLDPGVFTQGVGYRDRGGGYRDWETFTMTLSALSITFIWLPSRPVCQALAACLSTLVQSGMLALIHHHTD